MASVVCTPLFVFVCMCLRTHAVAAPADLYPGVKSLLYDHLCCVESRTWKLLHTAMPGINATPKAQVRCRSCSLYTPHSSPAYHKVARYDCSSYLHMLLLLDAACTHVATFSCHSLRTTPSLAQIHLYDANPMSSLVPIPDPQS